MKHLTFPGRSSLIVIAVTAAVFISAGIILALSPFVTLPQAIRVGASLPFVLFFPGLAWTYALFHANTIDALERIALAVGFSVALVPLTVFGMRLLGVPTTPVSIFFEILSLIIAGGAIAFIRVRQSNPQQRSAGRP